MRFLNRDATLYSITTPAWPTWRRTLRRRQVRTFLSVAIGAIAIGLAAWSIRSGSIVGLAQSFVHAVVAASADVGLVARVVEIEGRRRASQAEVIDALAINGRPALLGLDIDVMRNRLKSIAWVEDAVILRQYPDRLVVHIREMEPFAVWQHHRRFHLITQDGTLINTADVGQFGHLPIVVGSGAPTRAAEIMDLLSSIPDMKRRVEAAILVGERRWNLRLDNGMDVKLPETEPAAAWQLLADLERTHAILEKDVTIIDLRFHDRLVLRLALPPSSSALEAGAQEGNET